ncbi:hypothetical protein ZWY2020_023790 [Hordeum vulgare]|nr:hypothetical protein ZWY2020_023790 [Hordeum vulgare]
MARRCNPCWAWYAVALVLLVMAASGFYFGEKDDEAQRSYSVAIDSFSGLDPTTDLGQRPMLDPEFNFTFRVASSSLWVSVCVQPGLYVEVSYRGVSLASSGTMTERICAGPRNTTDHAGVARGVGVVVPGSVLNGLAADLRRGEQVFDVMIRGYNRWSCGSIRVGDPGSLRRACS